ncbi:MAG: sulfonate ABC transporter substrate-binding protein [Janthinobacterium lividum]
MPLSRPSSASRRGLLAGAAALALLPRTGHAADRTVRIGIQKYGTLIILRERKLLEPVLQPLGWSVSWHEFPGGPQLLEALTAGALDFGTTGEAPPIFAQAAGSSLAYVGYEPPSPAGEAILVPKDSPIRTVAELKGRTVALNKGSNVHYLLVRALIGAGFTMGDIRTAFLAPADARAAFERGSVDAWAIWDPFLSAAQEATGARTLVDGSGSGGPALAPNRQFFLARREFAQREPELLRTINAQVDATDRWAEQHQDEAARLLAASMRLPLSVVARAVGRMGYGVRPLTAEVVADQQKIADTFFDLRLIPQKLDVASAVWSPRS